MSADVTPRLLAALFAAALLAACATPAAASSARQNEADTVLERCRTALGRGGENSAQGILFDGELLCIYGPLSRSIAQVIATRNRTSPIETVVVRSYGGEVALWLETAESFPDGLKLLVIDGYCFSSCAIFFPPMAIKILADPGSLLVWHGGPNRWDEADRYGATSKQEWEQYQHLSQRTEAFLERYGINPEILWFSGQPLSQQLARQMDRMSLNDRVLAGYAFSPERLTKCFGFSSVDEFWHPGGHAQVMRLSKRLSQRFVVAEAPERSTRCKHPPN